MSSYLYTKSPVALDKLSRDIRASPIVTAFDLDLTQVFGDQLTLVFKDVLSSTDQQTLDGIVAAHDGVPLALPTPVFKIDQPADSDGSPIHRPKTTKTGWHFEPRSMDFYTAKFKSLYNRKYNGAKIMDGTDLGDGSLKFYDDTGALMVQDAGENDATFQGRLTTSCVKTICDWEPVFAYDLVGAYFQVLDPSPKNNPAYLWVLIAPDIPESFGGSVPFCNGGWNLSFFGDKVTLDVDGKGVKSFLYDPVYHSSKVRLLIKHDYGMQVGIQIIFKDYKA